MNSTQPPLRGRTVKTTFGIQSKILILLSIVIAFALVASAISVFGTITIKRSTDTVVFEQIPLLRSTQEALSLLAVGQIAVEKALDVDTHEGSEEKIKSAMETLLSSGSRFGMFLSAITWGSESAAFAKTKNGENLRLWKESGYGVDFIVPQASPAEAQLAGQASIYHEGFVNHARKALTERQRYLTYLGSGDTRLAEEAKEESKAEAITARVFADNVIKNLRLMVALANTSMQESAQHVEAAQRAVQLRTFLVGLVGLCISVFLALYISRRYLVRPIFALVEAAERFSAGELSHRTMINSGDELEILGNQFNSMADHLARYTQDLEKQVSERTKELNEKIATLKAQSDELHRSTELLIKRDVELTQANEKLRELDKAKSEFLSIAAHQLRTPLSAIKWVFSVILEEHMGKLSSEQKSYVIKGEESNNRMIRLVDDMLTVTRIESGKTEYHFYTLSLRDVLANQISDFMPRAQDRGLTLEYHDTTVGSTNAIIDPEKVRFVFENLIENAMRYTARGGKIAVTLSRDGDALVTRVSDTGIGIPVAERKNIFTKFFRATNAIKVVTDGSGLGLFVAKTIVERHGGTIAFESEVGTGTTFTVTLNHADSGRIPSTTDGTTVN